MLINTIANELRARNKLPVTKEMLQAELKELQAIKNKTQNIKLHIKNLKAYIATK